MSGTPPYSYLCLSPSTLVALGDFALQYLYDSSLIILDVGGDELFESGCLTISYSDGKGGAEHPVGSENISYPYCRTALRYNMSDLRADPQIGQLLVLLPFLSLKIILDGCDQSEIASVQTKVEPPVTKLCAVEVYPGYSPTELYLVIDRQALTFPTRVTFTVTNVAGVSKIFWVGLRDRRDGTPSGAVI